MKRSGFIPFVIFPALLFYPLTLLGQAAGVLTVTVKPNQSIREISRDYLGNSDLWEDILRANGLKSPADVKPGLALKIPVQAISAAQRELDRSLDVIKNATQSGGRLFAPDELNNAVYVRDRALESRRNGDWETCAKLAKSAADVAQKVLEVCRSKRNVEAEAVLDYKRGRVEARKTNDLSWEDIVLRGALHEGTKLRTMSKSYAEVLFRDESRLRLEENSQAHIKRLRQNLLDNTGESSVSLVEGNVLALLGGGRAQEQFKLEVPGVETKGSSQEFWVSRTEQTARFANYRGELEVAASGAAVKLKENQGSVVKENQKPTPPRDLLPPPKLSAPEDGIELFDADVQLVWAPVKGTSRYQVEIAEDNRFSRVKTAFYSRTSSAGLPKEIGSGLMFWRVTPLEADGLRGRPSASRGFRIINDTQPPYIVVTSPQEGAIMVESPAVLTGSVESGVKLTCNGQAIEVSDEGQFWAENALVVGVNELKFVAVDPAGNRSEILRRFTYQPMTAVQISLEPSLPERDGVFLAGRQGLTLKGQTQSHSRIEAVSLPDNQVRAAYADEAGRFSIYLPPRTSGTLELRVQTRGGAKGEKAIAVELDTIPPVIELSEPPRYVNEKKLDVSGRVTGAVRLSLNDERVDFEMEAFSHSIELRKGENGLSYSAWDEVGNVSVAERSVFYDPDAPTLLSVSAVPQSATGGETVTLRVRVRDSGKLAALARFKLRVGRFEHSGALRLMGDNETYLGTVGLPPNAAGRVEIVEVILTDYAGNSARVKP